MEEQREPPPGCRILKDREILKEGDLFWRHGAWREVTIIVGHQAYDGRFARPEYMPQTEGGDCW